MGIIDILWGTPEEIANEERLKQLNKRRGSDPVHPTQEAERAELKKSSRRLFMRRAATSVGLITVLSTAAGAYLLMDHESVVPEPVFSEVDPALYMPEGARILGNQIGNWKLSNGVSMAETFPEIRQAAELLQGKVDPRKYIPFGSIPVLFIDDDPEIEYSVFSIPLESDPKSKRKISVTTNDGRYYELSFFKYNSPITIALDQETASSSFKLPVAAKEASQIVDSPDYCEAYVAMLEKQGTLKLVNPENIPTSRQEFVMSMAYTQHTVNVLTTGSDWFLQFIDAGSHLRVGGIAFANWYLDQTKQGIIPTGKSIEVGKKVQFFLEDRRYIQRKGDMYVWTRGKAPDIKSDEFLNLFYDFAGYFREASK